MTCNAFQEDCPTRTLSPSQRATQAKTEREREGRRQCLSTVTSTHFFVLGCFTKSYFDSSTTEIVKH